MGSLIGFILLCITCCESDEELILDPESRSIWKRKGTKESPKRVCKFSEFRSAVMHKGEDPEYSAISILVSQKHGQRNAHLQPNEYKKLLEIFEFSVLCGNEDAWFNQHIEMFNNAMDRFQPRKVSRGSDRWTPLGHSGDGQFGR